MSHCRSVTSIINYEKIGKKQSEISEKSPSCTSNQDAQAKDKCQNIIFQVMDNGVKIHWCNELYLVLCCHNSVS